MGLAIALAIKASLVEELGRPLPDDPAARARGWAVSASALLSYRVLPKVAPGLEVAARRGFGEHVLVRVGALGVTAFGIPLKQQAGSFDATLVAARADACARGRFGSALKAGFCVGGLGGILYAVGADVARPTHSAVSLFALTNAAELELELSARWSLSLGFSVIFLLHRVRVGVEDASGMRAASRSLQNPGLALGLGPMYHF